MGVLTWSPLAGGFLSGNYRRDSAIDLTHGRPALQPERFDPSLAENAAKLEIVEQLVALASEIGYTLPELALAFPLAHPAVTSVIIGPRTLPQLEQLLAGATLTLDDRVLDRIDEIAAPGVDHYRITWRPPELDDPYTRRRSLSERSAAA
jgi:aryl-alcohol dehydrogenase-like predicted oxidoreductase